MKDLTLSEVIRRICRAESTITLDQLTTYFQTSEIAEEDKLKPLKKVSREYANSEYDSISSKIAKYLGEGYTIQAILAAPDTTNKVLMRGTLLEITLERGIQRQVITKYRQFDSMTHSSHPEVWDKSYVITNVEDVPDLYNEETEYYKERTANTLKRDDGTEIQLLELLYQKPRKTE